MRVLITGGCGICGTALAGLPHDLVFVDRQPAVAALAGCEFVQGDVTDAQFMRQVLQGADALIHLAAASQVDDTDEAVSRDNIEGVRIAFEAAKHAGVQRIIFGSSNHAVGMYELDHAPQIYEPGHHIVIDKDVPPRPDSFYGASKVIGEALGRYLAESGGSRFYAIRIGSVRAEGEDHPFAYAERGVRQGRWSRDSGDYIIQEKRLKSIWQSRRDFCQMIERCLSYDGPAFDVFYGVSDNDRRWMDIEYARKALGYEPQDNAEGWLRILDGAKTAAVPSRDKVNLDDLRVLAIVPLRIRAEDDLAATSQLLGMTLAQVRASRYIDRVLVAADHGSLKDIAEQHGAEFYLRPEELSDDRVRADDVLQHTLDQQERAGYHPDIVAPLEITHPFRPEGLFDQLIEKLVAENLDSVIAGFPEYRPCWLNQGEGLTRLDDYFKLRTEREPLHVGLPSLGCVTKAGNIRRGTRLGSTVGIYEVTSPAARIEIRSQADLQQLQHQLSLGLVREDITGGI